MQESSIRAIKPRDVLLEDMEGLKEIQKSLYQWGSSQFEKKKIPRADYEEFTNLCGKLALVINGLETRHSTLKYPVIADFGKKLDTIEDKLEQLSKEVVAVKSQKPTYAECLQLPEGRKERPSSVERGSELRIRTQIPDEQVIIIKPKEIVGTEQQSSENVKKTLKNNISNEQSLKIKKAVNVRGGGVLLVLSQKEDKNKVLGEKILQNPLFKVSEPQKIRPGVIIYNVLVDLTQEQIVNEVYNRNFKQIMPFDLFKDGFEPSFKVGPRDKKQVHWVVRCSGKVREMIICKSKILIDWYSCNVKDYLSVARCFKCQGLGHVGKHCRQQSATCSHCAEVGHDINACPNKGKKEVCANCKNQKCDSNPKVSDKNCPAYLKARRRLIDRTAYGA